MQRIKNFVLAHPNFFTFIGLGVIFYVIFFHNIWSYALMDTDEARYVQMAKEMFQSKDFLTLYLNNEYFFEKPPLYFWGECLSFAIFGKINEFTARFPVSLYGTACCYLVYFIGKKVVSRAYGVISALILATSLEFVILAKFAILDIVVSTCVAFSLGFGMITFFCRENHKKFYWWAFYAFSGLAVMAKGIPGFIIPFGSMFFMALFSKTFKEVFKPINIIPGILIFLLITLPWHILMFKLYNPLFWNEYIVKHHLARFMGSEVINRSQPFYFYIITLLWGFFPWIVSCICVWLKKLYQKVYKDTISFSYKKLDKAHKYILFNSIIVIFTLLFFSISETKLITYILPIYISMSALGAFVWIRYINNIENVSLINKTVYFLGGIMILASFTGILTPLYLPKQLVADIASAKTFCVLVPAAVGLASILFAKRKLYLGVFISYIVFMSLFSAYATKMFYEIDYKFGQNDLMEFAQYAKENNLTLTTYRFGTKYSLIFYGEIPVTYGTELSPENFQETLKEKNNLVIVPYKKFDPIKHYKFDIIKKGRKYLLLDEKGKNNVRNN